MLVIKMNKREMLKEAKSIYYKDDFQYFMRKMQNLTDDDFSRPILSIERMILQSIIKSPMKMFFDVYRQIEEEWLPETPVPVNNHWHHFVVPGVILSSMRNNGFEITGRDITEGMDRGKKLPGGSCGFAGTCGGAYSVGIIASVLNRTNPLHDEGRANIFKLVSDTLIEISDIGRRCCKRSSYIAIKNAVSYLSSIGYFLPLDKIECRYLQKNPMCYGIKCPFHPRTDSQSELQEG